MLLTATAGTPCGRGLRPRLPVTKGGWACIGHVSRGGERAVEETEAPPGVRPLTGTRPKASLKKKLGCLF